MATKAMFATQAGAAALDVEAWNAAEKALSARAASNELAAWVYGYKCAVRDEPEPEYLVQRLAECCREGYEAGLVVAAFHASHHSHELGCLCEDCEGERWARRGYDL